MVGALARRGPGPAAARHAAGLETWRPAGGRGLDWREASDAALPAALPRPSARAVAPELCSLRRFLIVSDFPAWTVEKLVRAERAP